MGAVIIRARHDLGRSWRSWSSLALITGILGGVVIGVFAGAARTDRAYDGFLVSQRAFQQFMFTTEFYPGTAAVGAEQLAELDTVDEVVPGMVFDGTPMIVMRGSLDERLDRTLNRVNVLEGRLPDPREPHEILVPLMLAEAEHLQVGGVRPFRLRLSDGTFGPTIDARVVGIGIAPGEFPPENDIATTRWAHVTPAFIERYADIGSPFAYVFLEEADRGLDAFEAELSARTGGAPIIGYQQASLTKNVRRAFRLQAVSLATLGVIIGLTAFALIAQTISRMTWLEARDNAPLSAVGMTRRQLTMVALCRVALAAAVASLVAVGVAYLLSPLMPAGRARLAVVDPGFTLDAGFAMFGALGLMVLVVGSAVVPAYRSAGVIGRAGAPAESRSRLVDVVQRWGVSPPASIGMRAALERGRGSTAVPARATLLGATIAVAAIAMTLTFGGGLHHLLETPRLYGSVYHLIGAPSEYGTVEDGDALIAELQDVPGIEAVTAGGVGLPFRVDGQLADGEAIDPRARGFLPPLLSGRYPEAADEILLGPVTLRAIGRSVGDEVQVSALGTDSKTFRVVGSGVIPAVGHSANLGEGSLVHPEAVHAMFPDDDSMGQILVKLRRGADVDELAEEIGRRAGPLLTEVREPLDPGDVVNFGGQRNLPFILVAILAGMALLTIAHALLSTVSRKRKDLAVLRAAGFTSSQARRAVHWHASTLAAIGLLIGTPAGVALGRWLWLGYASRIGVLPEASIPVVLVVLIVPATMLLANTVAWLPARRAVRVEPAAVLRAE